MNPASTPSAPGPDRWQRLAATALRGYHRYASWLVGISWKRFVLFAVALLVMASITASLPPFSWRVTETIEDSPLRPPAAQTTPAPPAPPAAPSGASGASATLPPPVVITLPPGVDAQAVREAVDDARAAIEDALQAQRDAKEAAHTARREADQAVDEAAHAVESVGGRIKRTRQIRMGDFLPQLALLWILASAIIKATYKSRMQAEEKAAQATEMAERESLERQLVEARMAAMQAQVEPHFLFNTLASIDHLIETDPPRASRMQKNLIALLRASMPDLREGAAGGRASARDLGRELQVIRPYLEILQVRMEERLQPRIDVPAGLLSAEFPPLMLQTLVENAIKHGLEPKAEGGQLSVHAEVVHGQLQVSVADTGLGLGRSQTAGTGVGLANIRERLRLQYGGQATLTMADNPGGGTLATITVPYRSVPAAAPQTATGPAAGAQTARA